MAFNPVNRAPGVYIDEIQLPGPIAGVGTSTAAFIGPAQKGAINEPTPLTSFSQFQDIFGNFIGDPVVYVTHAVNGFFENGGTRCFFVRVGTGKRAKLEVNDQKDRPTLIITAKEEGLDGNSLAITIQESHIANTRRPSRFTHTPDTPDTFANASGNEATINGRTGFREGDIVELEQGDNHERATINRVRSEGTGDEITTRITFVNTLRNSYDNTGTITTANLIPGQRTIRVENVTGIEAGSFIRITQGEGDSRVSEERVVESVERSFDGMQRFITLTEGLVNTYTIGQANEQRPQIDTLEFTVTVSRRISDGNFMELEQFSNLSINDRHSRYFENNGIITSSFVEINLSDPPSTIPPPDNRPTNVPTTVLTGGQNDNIQNISESNYENALTELEKIDDVNIICIPDETNQTVQSLMITHCEKLQDRFAILDPNEGADLSNQETGIMTQRNLVNSDRGFAALYFPRIYIANPFSPGRRLLVPPSGHIAGVYARTDSNRGVHKAPANESLRGVLELERTLSDGEQGPLNEDGINVIRSFPGRGIRVWGARTISPSIQWRYVNVRRLLLFIEESIQEGTQFAVFEPNNRELRQTVVRQVTEFLTRVWSSGALVGATPEEAFRVRADEELNPPAVRTLGQLIVEIILFPTTPAEFVVFRIIQEPGGPTIIEL
jgi:phage tail sheath protein FI